MPAASRLAALAVALVVCVGMTAATAQPGPLPLAPPQPIEAAPAPDSITGRFASSPACREMSDGCRVCVRGADGSPTCSMPGIACVPGAWQCRNDRERGHDSGPAR